MDSQLHSFTTRSAHPGAHGGLGLNSHRKKVSAAQFWREFPLFLPQIQSHLTTPLCGMWEFAPL